MSLNLEAEIAQLKDAGAIVNPDFNLDSYSNKHGKRYYRKRWYCGDKRMSQALSQEEYRELRKALDLGKRVRILEKAMSELRRSGV